MTHRYSTQVDGRLIIVVGTLLFVTGLLTGLLLGDQEVAKVSVLSASQNRDSDIGRIAGEGGENNSHGGAVVPPHSSEGHEKATALLVGVPCPCGRCQGALEECSSDLATEIVAIAAHLFTRGQNSQEVAQVLSANYGVFSGMNTLSSDSSKVESKEPQVFQEVNSRNSSVASEIEEILLKGK